MWSISYSSFPFYTYLNHTLQGNRMMGSHAMEKEHSGGGWRGSIN